MNIGRIVISAAAGLALVVGGTAAGATLAGPVDGSGAIHGCHDTGGNLKVIDASTTCPKGYTALNWSQAGPAGPAGPRGPKGDAGATGPQGPPGQGPASFGSLNGLLCTVNGVTGSIKISYTSNNVATLSCSLSPATVGTFPVGGHPDALASDGTHIWVANFWTGA